MKNEEFASAMKKMKMARSVLCATFFILLFSFFIFSCARMGSPDGGWYDDMPPSVVSASPADGGTDVTQKKIIINFNEFIKIENAQEKVIVSPPQIEQAEVKAAGKRIIVELMDTLKENTTYTIDFSDAITDNNEGNPMGNYTFSFSTGDHIDTLEVAGYVLNAEDLEPIKGILVGLYPYDVPDSTFRTEPMMRVSRTNGSGFFAIKGVAPGSYKAYALSDVDGNFIFSQKSEIIAWSNDSIVPSWKPDTRQDTIWRDSLHIDNILRKPYTHFLPDDVTLLAFQELQTDRYLLKTERSQPEKLGFYFTFGHDSLPSIKGLNFNADSVLVAEYTEKKDTVFYWLNDTTLVQQDTLQLEAKFWATDTLGVLQQKVDTLLFLPKVPYAKRLKEQQKELEKWQKEQEKKKKRGDTYDSIYPVKPLELKFNPSGQLTPLEKVRIECGVPLAKCDTSMIHLYFMRDSVWYRAAHEVRQLSPRVYELNADWQPATEYSLEVDSAAAQSIYGLSNKAIKQGLKVGSPDDFSTFVVSISGTPVKSDDSTAVIVVRLLDGSGKIVREVNADASGKATFTYVKPATYYLSAYCDMNGNGQWDTGEYDRGLMAEPVFFFNEEIECKAKWDVSRDWNVSRTPRYQQKPAKITKQKPDQAKKLKNRNLERAQKLGKEYLGAQGVKM